jgi:catechol 2,3-dioxygenase-like lactoylglutathione lyase family enzyme
VSFRLLFAIGIIVCCTSVFLPAQMNKIDSIQKETIDHAILIDSLPKESNKNNREINIRLKLFEIELHSKNPDKTKKFYNETLGLPIKQDINGLKIFDPGIPDIDFDFSQHYTQKTSFSFLVNDINKCREELISKGLKIPEPIDSHLGMKSIRFEDPDGNLIIINSPTEKSPQWLKNMIH